MDKIISLEGIHFQYDPYDPVVLSDLSLDIPSEKVTAILGPNGTGKTTLLHILLGLVKTQPGDHPGGWQTAPGIFQARSEPTDRACAPI